MDYFLIEPIGVLIIFMDGVRFNLALMKHLHIAYNEQELSILWTVLLTAGFWQKECTEKSLSKGSKKGQKKL